jgi:hypothetical protein
VLRVHFVAWKDALETMKEERMLGDEQHVVVHDTSGAMASAA